MSPLNFQLIDGVSVDITITQLDDGSLKFDLIVLDDTGTIGDLNGLFFDMLDGALAEGLTVSGDDVTGVNLKEDSVTKVDSYNSVNGEIVKDYGKFDAGVQFGTSGISTDDIRQTSFVLSHDSVELTLDMFYSMDFAARLTSVGEDGGDREDSLKIGGTAPAEPVVEGPVNVANGDTMTASQNETFSDEGLSDPLDGFRFSLLENDTSDEFAYTGLVTSANGQAFDDTIVVAGSNGGLLQINSDGTVDFSANGEFDHLSPTMETQTTQFEYGIEGGLTTTLDVTVFYSDGDGGGGVGFI